MNRRSLLTISIVIIPIHSRQFSVFSSFHFLISFQSSNTFCLDLNMIGFALISPLISILVRVIAITLSTFATIERATQPLITLAMLSYRSTKYNEPTSARTAPESFEKVNKSGNKMLCWANFLWLFTAYQIIYSETLISGNKIKCIIKEHNNLTMFNFASPLKTVSPSVYISFHLNMIIAI